MRLPRPQVSLSQLFFIVVIVALNLGVFRSLYGIVADVHGGYPLSTDWMLAGVIGDYRPSIQSFGLAVGFIPLVNIALLGTFLYATRWLRSSRGQAAGSPRPSPAGFTFFSLHFLFLGFVVCVVMPEAITIYSEIVEWSMEPASEACAAYFSRFGDTLPWFVIECTIRCICISGPLLVLALMGSAFARRCAAALPRLRFRLMTGLVSFGFASAALAIALIPVEFEDEQNVALDFQVVEKGSGQPIARAFVRISDPFGFESENRATCTPMAYTASDGCVRLTCRLPAFGERNAFRSMGAFSPWGRWLEISAVHFQTMRVALPEALGSHIELGSGSRHRVELATGTTPDASFPDIAGTYVMPSSGSGREDEFNITPDGRFAWSIYGWVQPSFHEYGYLKRNKGEIELKRIRHPRSELDPELSSTIRVILWNDRLYLSAREDRGLPDLFRAALTRNRRVEGHTFGAYVRVSQTSELAKTLTGLPRVPSQVWVKVLLDEMNPENDDRLLKIALESLVAKSTDVPTTVVVETMREE
jgi:hypothetical protein